MKSLLLSTFILITLTIRAQDSCSCMHKLDKLIDIVARNYAGFYDKVLNGDRDSHNALAEQLRKVALSVESDTACSRLLETYCSFFHDKQLGLYTRSIVRPDTTSWTAASLMNYFDTHADHLLELEGIWCIEQFELGLIYSESTGRYQGVVMHAPLPEWKEGMVKCTIALAGPDSVRSDYWRINMRRVLVGGFRVKDHIALGDIGVLHRRRLGSVPLSNEVAFNLEHSYELQWRVLDDSTLYIKVGACLPRVNVQLDSLIKANSLMLQQQPDIIIDLRHSNTSNAYLNNGLLTYIQSRPYQDPGYRYWLSPANIEWRMAPVTSQRDKRQRSRSKPYVKMLRGGQELLNSWSEPWSMQLPYDSTRFRPGRVAILADTATNGSAELFLIMARGLGDRVLIFGQHTAGGVDYGEPALRPLGCNNMNVYCPTTRRNWLDHGVAYNASGVQPNVQLDTGVNDPIDFVRAYWQDH
ncbi:MAG: hypothetical protein IPP83_07055 [Flavobacteriales bacterium]|nr:hypothetical protein [Flavobacteriales bacterium]